MANDADAADARKPFNWEAIEDDDEDELSFGSDYESDPGIGVDASAPQSGDTAGVVAARSVAEDGQPGLTSPKSEEGRIKAEDVKLEAIEDRKEFYKEAKVDVLPHGTRSFDAKPERKPPRTPVQWTQPPPTSTNNDKNFVNFSGGVRGRSAVPRGIGPARTAVHKNVFNAASRAQQRARDPWPSRGRFCAHETVMAGIGSRGVPRPQLPVERGQFMTKHKPNVPQRSHGDGMGSALDQLKIAATPIGLAIPSALMNPAARPFQPRPPLRPPQHMHQQPPQQQLHPQPSQRPAPRPQIRPMQFALPRPVQARPSGSAWPAIAPASTWVRGQSDPVVRVQPSSAETKAAPADNKAAQKPVKSSTWVNPNVAAPVVPRPVAAATAVAPINKQDDATAEVLRQKDEEIARLKAKLERQVPPKRQHEEKKEEEEKVSPECMPRKLSRGSEGTRIVRTALQSGTGSDGGTEEPTRHKGDIFSRMQFNNRNRSDATKEVQVKEEKPFSPQLSRGSGQRRELHCRDSGRHGHPRVDRDGHGGRQGDDRRYKLVGRRIDKRQPEVSDEQKLRRVQRFGGTSAR